MKWRLRKKKNEICFENSETHSSNGSSSIENFGHSELELRVSTRAGNTSKATSHTPASRQPCLHLNRTPTGNYQAHRSALCCNGSTLGHYAKHCNQGRGVIIEDSLILPGDRKHKYVYFCLHYMEQLLSSNYPKNAVQNYPTVTHPNGPYHLYTISADSGSEMNSYFGFCVLLWHFRAWCSRRTNRMQIFGKIWLCKLKRSRPLIFSCGATFGHNFVVRKLKTKAAGVLRINFYCPEQQN